jgi:hypothetical protein
MKGSLKHAYHQDDHTTKMTINATKQSLRLALIATRSKNKRLSHGWPMCPSMND